MTKAERTVHIMDELKQVSWMRGYPAGKTEVESFAALRSYAAAIADIVHCAGAEAIVATIQRIPQFVDENPETARERVIRGYEENLEGYATDLDWLMAQWAGTWKFMPMPIEVRRFFGRRFHCADGKSVADIEEATA